MSLDPTDHGPVQHAEAGENSFSYPVPSDVTAQAGRFPVSANEHAPSVSTHTPSIAPSPAFRSVATPIRIVRRTMSVPTAVQVAVPAAAPERWSAFPGAVHDTAPHSPLVGRTVSSAHTSATGVDSPQTPLRVYRSSSPPCTPEQAGAAQRADMWVRHRVTRYDLPSSICSHASPHVWPRCAIDCAAHRS